MKVFEPLLENNQGYKQCSDNWLFEQMNGLVKQLNLQDRLTSNEDLEQYTNMDSDFNLIYFELKELQQQSKERSEFHRSIKQKLFPRRIVKIVIYEIISNSTQLINLVLLDEVTNSIEAYQTDKNLKPFIYLILLAFFSVMRALFQSLAQRELNLIGVRIRISLNYLIFQKILQGQVGEINNDENAGYVANINNLILTDVDKIMLLQRSLQDGIAALILLAGCLTILFVKNAKAGIYVIIIIVFAQIYNVFSSFLMMKAVQIMLKFKDKRIGLSTDLIEGMKQIKYLTWEEIFSKQIMFYRKKEFMMLIVAKICDGLLGIFWNNINYILLYAYLTNALKHGSILGDLNVFTLIAIFKTIIFPLGIIPFCINFLVEANVSLKRIMDYLYTNDIDTKFKKQDCSTDAISLTNCSMKWPKISVQNDDNIDEVNIENDSHKFQLTIKRLNIQFNTLNFIIGKIGSGKSALLNCILNEMEQLSDADNASLVMNGSVSYCSQSSWVQNLTIQQNIIFGKKLNLQFYEKVLEVCQLQRDLNQFEKRDLHMIGPDGKNLSGGQKQRIAIARSLYTDSDIYLFDDIFSSLDVHVSDVLFKQAILQFLIGRQKTVVFVTSHYRHIFSVPQNIIKQVILLNNGQIEFDEEQIQNFLKENPDNEKDEDLIDTPSLQKVESQTQHVHSLVEEDLEEREIGSVNISTWLFYFKSMNWVICISYFSFSLLMQVSLSFMDFWLKSQLTEDQSIFQSIDEYFQFNFSNIFLFLLIISFIITLMKSILYIIAALGASWRIFRKLNNILTWSNMKFYDTTNSGRIVNRLSNDIDQVDTELPWTIDIAIEILTRVLGYMGGLIIMLPQMSFIIILVFFMYYHIAKLYMKTNIELKRLKQVNNSSILQWINETSGGIKIIRCQNQQEYFEQNYCNKFKNWINTDQCCERAKYWFTVRLNLASNLMLIGSICLIIILLLFSYDKYSSLFALSLTYSIIIIESFADLFEFYLTTEQNMVSVERIKQYFNNSQENIDHHKLIKIADQIKDTSIAIQFKSIQLAYDELNPINLALNNVSFIVHKGEKVAFLGRTGSGKTSIFNVLFGLYPFKGELLINGENADYMSLREQRNSLSIVPQFGFLFNGSVKQNIDPEDLLEKQALEDLFKDSVFHLRKKESEMNCDFMIAQNGSNLSNGEKQLLNFMRIISQNKEIVCLDEATSNMDPETDKALHNLLFKYVENRTLLTITHRLENIEKYDKIIIMDKGEIVEQGKYTELIQNSKGFLFNLIQNTQWNLCK